MAARHLANRRLFLSLCTLAILVVGAWWAVQAATIPAHEEENLKTANNQPPSVARTEPALIVRENSPDTSAPYNSNKKASSEPVIPLTVRALLNSGQPNTRCTISLTSMVNGQVKHKEVDASGQAIFHLGVHGPVWLGHSDTQIKGSVLSATATPQDWMNMPLKVDVKPQDNDVIVLRPTATATIRGFVRDHNGRGISDGKLSYHPIPFTCNTLSGENGAFLLRGVPPGQGSLHTDLGSPSSQLELLSGEELEIEIIIPPTLTLRVVDESSDAVLAQPTVYVKSLEPTGPWSEYFYRSIRGSESERTRALHPPAGMLRIQATPPKGSPFYPATIDLPWQATHDQTVTISLRRGSAEQTRLVFPSDCHPSPRPNISAWVAPTANPSEAFEIESVLPDLPLKSSVLNLEFPSFPSVNGTLVVQVDQLQFETPCWTELGTLAKSLEQPTALTTIRVNGWGSNHQRVMPLRLGKVTDSFGVPIPLPNMARFQMHPTHHQGDIVIIQPTPMLKLPPGSYMVSIEDTLGRNSVAKVEVVEGLDEVTIDFQF